MRRTRFTVTVLIPSHDDPQRKVILAYDADGACNYFQRRNYVVLNVERGDYRRVERRAAAPAGGFTIDRVNLAEAIDLLGIKFPVQIKFNSRNGATLGNHRFVPRAGKFKVNPDLDTASGGMVHRIMLKSYLTPDQAGRTLWHELTHAMQAERESASAATMREAFEAWRFCSARGRGTTYLRKPIEVEAREHEPLNDDLPLAR